MEPRTCAACLFKDRNKSTRLLLLLMTCPLAQKGRRVGKGVWAGKAQPFYASAERDRRITLARSLRRRLSGAVGSERTDGVRPLGEVDLALPLLLGHKGSLVL